MKALKKNILREILGTKSRFISILAIIGLSTGFFTGIKASGPSLMKTGLDYMAEKNLMDLRLVSTVGFDDDDIRAIKENDNTLDVMPGYSADLITSKNNIDTVIKVISQPEKTDTNNTIINEPLINEGRLASGKGECVMESYYFYHYNYKLGDTIVFNPVIQGNDTTDIIKDLEFKIVGVVSSPVYITYQRENTNVGDGTVAYFIMVPSEEFSSERYTNVFLTTKKGKDHYNPYNDEYKDYIEKAKTSYTDLSEERITIFNNNTLSDAKQKLADARKEYSDKKEETHKELSDGEKELHKGEKELADKVLEGEKKIADSEKQLEKGKKELADGQKKYSEGINEAKTKLTDARQKYSEGKTEYTKAKLEYDTKIEEAQNKLDDAQTEFNTQYQLFYGTTKPQAETKLSLLKTAIDACKEVIEKTKASIEELEKNVTVEVDDTNELEKLKNKLDEYNSKLDEYNDQYEDGKKQLKDGEDQLNNAKTELENAKNEFRQKKAEGAVSLNDAQIKLDEAESQLEIGELEYKTAMTTGILEIEEAQSKISEAENQIEKGKAELEKQRAAGMEELKKGREKLNAGKSEAARQLSEAGQKLSDAEKQLDALNDAKWYVFARDDNPGYSGLQEDAGRIDRVATIFPFFFMLVASLVCLTTMSRMVEERRTEIGTLKALGYSNFSIALKYFVYSSIASVTGSIIGGILGMSTIPKIIVDTYSMLYTLPESRIVIPFDIFLFASGLGLLCTSAVAVVSCLGELRLRPAPLMRPKAPKPGKRILLEYFTFIWKHLNFTSKVTMRNLFRYKIRFLMTVVGVAGCTALIIGALGLKDSLSVIADRQYKELTVFDQIYALSEPGSSKELGYIMSQFHADKRFKEAIAVQQDWITINHHKDKKISLRTIIAENDEHFRNIFNLRDRETHEAVTLTDEGAVINERLSQVVGTGVGENLEFTMDGETYTVRITGITENYAGNAIYLTPELFTSITNKEPIFNIVYTQISEDYADEAKDIANDWMEKDEILTVSVLEDQLNGILSTLDSLNVIVLVVVICAGMLAMVVLYNLTNINISERTREIATIKVLGFYNMETANYIYRENIILTLTGATAGLPLGMIFLSFIVESIQMEMVMFPKYITIFSYLAGFALTLLFSLLVNFIMYFKMKKISMVESLKSIE